MIHPTAVVSSKSHISQNVKVGPYCIIDDNVYIDQNTELISHVHITGYTTIGKNNNKTTVSGNNNLRIKYS